MRQSQLFSKASLLLMILPLSSLSVAQEILTIESTITGSREQPKVISIVPWQKPQDPSYLGKEVGGIGMGLDVFQEFDRETFNQERRYILSTRKGAQDQ